MCSVIPGTGTLTLPSPAAAGEGSTDHADAVAEVDLRAVALRDARHSTDDALGGFAAGQEWPASLGARFPEAQLQRVQAHFPQLVAGEVAHGEQLLVLQRVGGVAARVVGIA